MIFIKIGHYERKLEEADQGWIVRTISGERAEYGQVCVRVRFDLPGVKLDLVTPCCGPRGGRPIDKFNPAEQQLIGLWQELGLSEDPDFPPGKVVAFIQRLSRVLRVAI
jgi:hypothetical protein